MNLIQPQSLCAPYYLLLFCLPGEFSTSEVETLPTGCYQEHLSLSELGAEERRKLEILCSSCLVAVCSTQINIKAEKTLLESGDVKDPRTAAIRHEIKNMLAKKKHMPSYTQHFNQARLYIRSMLESGALAEPYKGPSPGPANPIAWQEEGAMEGYQDLQLMYNGWYTDADRARFLDPFSVPVGESLSPPLDDRPTRYPHDEM